MLGLIGSLLVARLSTAEPLGSANDRSRWCTVWSLGTQGTYRIDEIIRRPGWDTIDKVRHEGHFYSTKPPLFTTLLAGLYWGIHWATGLNLLNDTATVGADHAVAGQHPAVSVGLVLLLARVDSLRLCRAIRLLVIALAGLATLLTPFLTVLNNHTAGAISLLFTTVGCDFSAGAEWGLLAGDWSRERLAVCRVWFLCGAHMLQRVARGVVGPGNIWPTGGAIKRPTATWFIPAALIPLIGFFVTNYLATGGWKPFYMYYGTEKYVYEHLGVASYWSNPQGVDKARFHACLRISLPGGSSRDFFVDPLVPVDATRLCAGDPASDGRPAFPASAGSRADSADPAVLLKRTENYNYGGVSVALRWVLWLIPFWLLAVAEWLQRCRRVYSLVLVLLILGSPSLYSAWSCWNTPWQHPWLFKSMESRGWINYSDPPEPLPRPIHGWVNGLLRESRPIPHTGVCWAMEQAGNYEFPTEARLFAMGKQLA
ncbi:MAG: hypothetical protein R3C12_03110 [Planctomycetaceae bacterium]